jgi:hypothetical protein
VGVLCQYPMDGSTNIDSDQNVGQGQGCEDDHERSKDSGVQYWNEYLLGQRGYVLTLNFQ